MQPGDASPTVGHAPPTLVPSHAARRRACARYAACATSLAVVSLASAAAAQPAATPAPSSPTSDGAAGATPRAPRRPFRLHERLGVDWLRVGLEQRLRVEHLTDDYRKTHDGRATGLFARTLLSVELRAPRVSVLAEAIDARAYANDGAPLDTTHVDALDLLQAGVRLRLDDLAGEGDALQVTAGRMTLDLGSRRLVARNDFRNTVNAFTGLDVRYETAAHASVRGFALMPVVRRPTDPDAVADDALEADVENHRAVLFGAFVESKPLAHELRLEAYALGLLEADRDDAPSRDRRLATTGLRLRRGAARGAVDGQLEVMAQVGRSRATTAATDTTWLDHRAWSLHGTLGRTFDTWGAPRLALILDYATGDRDPSDGRTERFDPLFGARRFDFGPTGLYGTFARANLLSPVLRVELEPHAKVDLFVAYRAAWLASARDAWTPANQRDPSGDSGTFVGHQPELRVRVRAIPGNLLLDVGATALVPGEFARTTRGDDDASVYVYTQVTTTL